MGGASSSSVILAATPSSSVMTEVSALTERREASSPAAGRQDGELLLLPETGPRVKSDACCRFISISFPTKGLSATSFAQFCLCLAEMERT